MGHSLAHIELTNDDAEVARTRAAQHRGARFWGAPSTFASEMVSIAVAKWHADEAGRYDSQNAGSGYLASVIPEAVIDMYADEHHDRVATESVVIPVAANTDVVEKKHRVKIPVTAEQLAAIHAVASTWGGLSSDHTGMTQDLWGEVRKQFGLAVSAARVVSVPAARKPTATVTAGKAVTVYEVIVSRYGRQEVLATRDTQAEARAEAIRLMEADQRLTRLAVRGCIQRVAEDGARSGDLLTISRPAAANATITVEVARVAVKPNAEPASYRVLYDYHH